MRMSLLSLAMLSSLMAVPVAHAIDRTSPGWADNAVVEAYYYHGHHYRYYSNHHYYNHRYWRNNHWHYY